MKVNYLGEHVYRFEKEDKICMFNALSLKRIYIDKSSEQDVSLLFLKYQAPLIDIANVNTLQIVVSTKCNFRCIYCQLFQNDNPCAVEEMSIDTVNTIYEKYRNVFETGTIMITGGEPLLNFDIVNYLLSKANGRKMIFTNASLLTDKIIQVLLDTETFVIVSLDGNEHLNDLSRQTTSGAGTYKEIIKGIDKLSEANCPYGISMVITSHNLKELSDVSRLVIETLRPVSLGVNTPHYTKRYKYDFQEETFANEFIKLYFLSKEKGIFIDQIARILSPIIKETPRTRDCSACGYKAVIFPDFTESNCILKYMFTHGNDLNIWTHSAPTKEPMCNDCIAIGACGGSCRFDGEMFFESTYDKRRCPAIKKLVTTIIFDLFDEDLSKLNAIVNVPNVWSVGHDRL